MSHAQAWTLKLSPVPFCVVRLWCSYTVADVFAVAGDSLCGSARVGAGRWAEVSVRTISAALRSLNFTLGPWRSTKVCALCRQGCNKQMCISEHSLPWLGEDTEEARRGGNGAEAGSS